METAYLYVNNIIITVTTLVHAKVLYVRGPSPQDRDGMRTEVSGQVLEMCATTHLPARYTHTQTKAGTGGSVSDTLPHAVLFSSTLCPLPLE